MLYIVTLALIAATGLVIYWSRWPIQTAWQRLVETRLRPDIRRRRLAFIQVYEFPSEVRRAFRSAHPTLGQEPEAAIFWALKDYFSLLALGGGGDAIAMPSRIVGAAWALFAATDGNGYADFCRQAFGIHVPPQPVAAGKSDPAIVRTWHLLCARLGIDPAHPTKLPRLFALDRRLGVENGIYYALSAQDLQSMGHANLAVAVYLLTEFGAAQWSDPGALMWTQSHAADLAGMAASSGAAYPSEMAPAEGGFVGGGDGFMADSGGGMDFGGGDAGGGDGGG